MLDTLTNNVLIFFICVSCPSSLQLTCLITDWVYFDNELDVISLVGCHALTAFMTSCSSDPNVVVGGVAVI